MKDICHIRLCREPDKARYINAVRHMQSPEIPFFETEVDFGIVNAVTGSLLQGIRSYSYPANEYVRFLEMSGMDMAYLHVPWKFGRKEIVNERGMSVYAGGTIRDKEDMRQLKDPGCDGIKRRIEEMLEALKNSKIGIIYAMYNTTETVMAAVGYQRFYEMIPEEPDLLHDFLERVNEYVVKQAEIVMSYPVDAIFIAASLCMKTGPMVSHETAARFYFPYMKQTADIAHKKSKIVSLHTDGDNNMFYMDYIGMGLDVVHPVENCGSLHNIYELKKLYGDRLAFHGNIDVEEFLIKGSGEDIKPEVKRHISELGAGGGYICSSSHDINEQVQVGNFIAMAEAIQQTRYEGV